MNGPASEDEDSRQDSEDGAVAAGLSLEDVDYDRVARISKRVRLRDVGLKSFHANLHVPTAALPQDWGDRAFIAFDTRAMESEQGADLKEFEVEAAFLCLFSPEWDPTAGIPAFDTDNPPSLELEATFRLTYETEEAELPDDDLQHFAIANGTHNAWPYWRELAQAFAQRMRVPPILIRTFTLPSKHDPS